MHRLHGDLDRWYDCDSIKRPTWASSIAPQLKDPNGTGTPAKHGSSIMPEYEFVPDSTEGSPW